MRNMRDTKILLQKTLMSPEAKFKIAHTGKNLIMIDSEEHENENDDEEEDECIYMKDSVFHNPEILKRRDFKILH